MMDQASVDKLEKVARELTVASGMDVELETEHSDQGLYFNVTGPDSGYFLANKGEALKSATHLLHALHRKDHPDSEDTIKFDAEWSQRGREEEVRKMALAAAEQPGFWDATEGKGEYTLCNVVNAGNAPSEATPWTMKFYNAYAEKWGVEPEGLATESVGEGHLKSIRVMKESASNGA